MMYFMHPLLLLQPFPLSPPFSIFVAMNRLAWIILSLLAACGQRAADHPADTVRQEAKNIPSPAGAPAAQPPPQPTADTAAPPPVSSDSTTTPATVSLPNNQAFTATVDGVEWSGIQVIASRVDSAIAITAVGPNGTSLIINFGKQKAPGTLSFGAANPGPFATWISAQGVSFSTEPGGTGNARITRLDSKRVAGTFSVTAAEQGGNGKVQIREGNFDVMFGK